MNWLVFCIICSAVGLQEVKIIEALEDATIPSMVFRKEATGQSSDPNQACVAYPVTWSSFVTSAHCVESSPLQLDIVGFGLATVESIAIPERFGERPLEDGVAIIRFVEPLATTLFGELFDATFEEGTGYCSTFELHSYGDVGESRVLRWKLLLESPETSIEASREIPKPQNDFYKVDDSSEANDWALLCDGEVQGILNWDHGSELAFSRLIYHQVNKFEEMAAHIEGTRETTSSEGEYQIERPPAWDSVSTEPMLSATTPSKFEVPPVTNSPQSSEKHRVNGGTGFESIEDTKRVILQIR